MKKAISTLNLIVFALLAVFLTSGCNESSSSDRKTRIIANQNMELKKQLEEKNTEIENQKSLVADCNKEIEKMKKQTDDTAMGFLRMMTDTSKQITDLQEENAALKEKVKQLEEGKK